MPPIGLDEAMPLQEPVQSGFVNETFANNVEGFVNDVITCLVHKLLSVTIKV